MSGSTWPARLIRRAKYAGRAHRCPNCAARLRAYEMYSPLGSQCPRCGARDRHRLLAAYLRVHSAVARNAPRVLHFAPEHAIRRVLDDLGAASYLSVDLEPGRADLAADITSLPLDDDGFDLVICSHVLEHVAQDSAALRELARVTAPQGEALILIPVSYSLEATVEDPDTTPEERLRRFGQDDHVRVYGRDFTDRMAAAGLEASVFDSESLTPEQRELWGLRTEFGAYGLRNEIFVCQASQTG